MRCSIRNIVPMGMQRRAGAPPPKGLAKEKAEWLKPGLVGRVKFLKGEEKLRHASLQDFRREDNVAIAGRKRAERTP
jgi:hypothetical protein